MSISYLYSTNYLIGGAFLVYGIDGILLVFSQQNFFVTNENSEFFGDNPIYFINIALIMVMVFIFFLSYRKLSNILGKPLVFDHFSRIFVQLMLLITFLLILFFFGSFYIRPIENSTIIGESLFLLISVCEIMLGLAYFIPIWKTLRKNE